MAFNQMISVYIVLNETVVVVLELFKRETFLGHLVSYTYANYSSVKVQTPLSCNALLASSNHSLKELSSDP